MGAHTHDDVDWAAKLPIFQRSDRLHMRAHREIADRLLESLASAAPRARPTVLDIGCGAGGMAAALTARLADSGGGTVVVVDAVPELLIEAENAVRAAAKGHVEVRAVRADVADDALAELVPAADLVWASRVVHHLPDQQAGLRRLAGLLREGGLLAIGEGGLPPSYLPWDVGVGEPGFQQRLDAARDQWFGRLRAGISEVVRMPYGWSAALGKADLREVSAFSVLTDHPAPAAAEVRDWVVDRVSWLAESGHDWLTEQDRATAARLTDPADSAYLGDRDDVFLLVADSVHYGWK
ncbi:methyltransferase family protein [Tamaricihabitans halophyticus]|uniref:Methyltransferase family protein n=1 Tax=Tamaricihabitans halophyticus TaxID=1262583 RepID=A0A4R2Q6X6_9PSEU|nr:class I SAM-dependent methyltransferase [Tamaricihabitans halophyticus]TCP43628.1 methyltransferase family protein [Tamaricihabitans halophyticus]